MIMNGPKGICDESFFLFLIKSGITLIKATNDEKNITNGIDIQPNQKPEKKLLEKMHSWVDVY